MKLLDEYKKSLKMAEAEEYLDLGFYRPIAFAIVIIGGNTRPPAVVLRSQSGAIDRQPQ